MFRRRLTSLSSTVTPRYDTGQIADFLVMDDFKLRFAQCGVPGDVATCAFSTVRSGLIVAMLSIGTLIGSLIGA